MNWERFWNESAQVQAADACRQVGRTLNGMAYSGDAIDLTTNRLLVLLAPQPDSTLLDVCCGNGMLTSRLAPRFAHVTGVDYSKPLIRTAQARFSRHNVDYELDDARSLARVGRRFDRALVSAGLQFFDERDTERVFDRVGRLIDHGGRLVLADIADRDRLFRFYRGLQGRVRLAAELVRRRPTIGQWWRPRQLLALADRTGWDATIHYQPDDLPNHYFRFDAVLIRRETAAHGRPRSASHSPADG
jgi:ubiquinone/menaquinone biosynthesis C-methylase UbiE